MVLCSSILTFQNKKRRSACAEYSIEIKGYCQIMLGWAHE
jgi:hypothetical protein